MADLKKLALDNEKKLKDNLYPGRGIIIGKSPDGKKMIQVYWIMGRSENSRNRVFESDNGYIRTKAFDESKVTDPSLIIYYPAKHFENIHIATNGDQTDTIFEFIKSGKTFEDALQTREFEPDAPNYTPRISGIMYMDTKNCPYSLSILKSMGNAENYCQRSFFRYEKAISGYGHCIHTYMGDEGTLLSYEGEPFVVRLFDDINEVMDYYWTLLNEDNKISLLVKFIDIDSKEADIKIINKNA
ncbi:MAG TPA: IMP cyclohydrolase [Clostridia bacterium]|nr:IMP cyclohydrolase [Clostridia bacterium]